MGRKVIKSLQRRIGVDKKELQRYSVMVVSCFHTGPLIENDEALKCLKDRLDDYGFVPVEATIGDGELFLTVRNRNRRGILETYSLGNLDRDLLMQYRGTYKLE